MKILVTGANGYLGCGVVNALLDLNYEVIAVDFKTDNIDSRAKIISCDLFNVENPYESFQKPDVLVHLAWKDGFVHYSDTHISDLPNHYFFIKKIIEGGIKNIAIMGSMHEIGFYEGSIDENTICNPITPYGIAKDALRKLVFSLGKNNDISIQWLRGFYIVGNTKFGSSIFSKITAAVLDGKKTFPFTKGQNQFDFLDYNDFCSQVAASVTQNVVDGIINICSGYPEKLADRVERFIKDNKYDIKLEYGAFPDRPYDSKAVWGSNLKITEILNAKKNA